MNDTPNLRLPYILAAQAQKHVTHNEAIRALDAIVQLSVVDRDLGAPPGAPDDGDRYIVAASPSGAWSGQAGKIAAYQDGAWAYYAPEEGWIAWVADEDVIVVWNGSAWVAAGSGGSTSLNPASGGLVGVNATADTTNRLSVSSPASLFNHEGAGHQQKINKAAAGDTASVLFQTAFSGRAEFGLTGDDDWHVKTSPDGSTWKEALIADKDTGEVRFPNGLLDATTLQRPALLLPSTVKDVWRSNMDSPASPRAYTISSVSGTTITLTASSAEQILGVDMHGISMVRIWNTSKAPAQSAWVDWQLAGNQLRVTNAAHVSGWTTGETIRLGDPNPTGANTLEMIAIDVSPYLQTYLGSVFRQRGLKLSFAVQGVGGRVTMDCSGSGILGSAFGVHSNSDGGRQSAFVDVFTTELSPVSNSNLLFVRETLITGSALAATRLMRLVGVWT